MQEQDEVYSRLWARLGLFQIWDRRLLIFGICVTALLSYAFDAVRLDNYSFGWIPVNMISLALAVLIVLVALKIAKTRNLTVQDRAIFNIFLAATAMGLKNVVTLALCPIFGIEDSGSWIFRFIGGACIGVAVLVIYSNLRGARIESLLIQAELLAKEQALRGFRENITDYFAKEQQALTERTSAELLPRLEELQSKVHLGQTGSSLTKEFQKFLSNEVRPLSNALAKEATSLKLSMPSSADLKQAELDVRVNLSKSIHPISTGILVFIAWRMLSLIVLPEATLMDVFVATLIFQGGLIFMKLLVSKLPSASINQALLFAPIPGTIASVPSYYLFYQIPHDQSQQNLLPTFLVVGAWSCLTFSLAYILDRGRAVAEARLKELVNQFSEENKLFEQKLWIAQHVWYTLLHGSVQSALTAAAIKAARKTELTDSDQEAIMRDLNRAIAALKNPSIQEVDLDKGLQELGQTWAGILEIKVEISSDISNALADSPDARLLTNEILKEAVGNAVKHGQASTAEINLTLAEGRYLYVRVSNNGKQPKSGSGNGIGSKIFNAVCLQHSLTYDSAKKETVFEATIPLA